MRHCTIEELLAHRDGEGSVWTRTHLRGCAECQGEYEALNQRVAALRALPALRAPRDQWPAMRGRLARERRRRRLVWGLGSLAVAASIAAVALASGVLTPRPGLAQEIAKARATSQQLEAVLQEYDPNSRVLSGPAAAVAAELEDRIALIDGQLQRRDLWTGPKREETLVTLWRSRVDLMNQLVQVHVTRAAFPGL